MNKTIVHLIKIVRSNVTITRGCKTAAVARDNADLPANFIDDEDDLEAVRRQEIEKKREKSRLLPQHLRTLKDSRPYNSNQSWIHQTVKYQRMMFGRYGSASGVDPRICFPTDQEKANQSEYEQQAYPYTILEIKAKIAEQRRVEKEEIIRREEQISKKLEKLDVWTRELNERINKRESEARAAKEKKERLVEEVRRHFGFKVDPRDERFKELLAQKEKEDKKKTKEAKRQVREAKIMAKLLDQEKGKPETPSATN